MKTCPKCNRTFEDSFSFCLEDGTVLSSPHNELDDEVPTRVLTDNTSVNPQTSLWKYAFIGLVLVFLLGIGITVAVFFMNMRNSQDSPNQQTSIENQNSKGSDPTESPTQTPKEVEKPSPTIEEKTEETPIETTPTPKKEKQKVNKLDEAISELKQEMSYAKARKILINSGWQAVVRSPNREKFGSEEYIFDKLGFTEVESCSGTGMGYCRFLFKDLNNRKLVVVTAGNEEGIEGGPVLNNWFFER